MIDLIVCRGSVLELLNERHLSGRDDSYVGHLLLDLCWGHWDRLFHIVPPKQSPSPARQHSQARTRLGVDVDGALLGASSALPGCTTSVHAHPVITPVREHVHTSSMCGWGCMH